MKGKLSKKRLISIAGIGLILLVAIVAIVINLPGGKKNVSQEDDKTFVDENLFMEEGENVEQEPDREENPDENQGEKGTNIDIYLIGGQSNAAGFTTFDSNTLKEMNAAYINGFDNIYYAGTACNPNNENLNPYHTSLTLAKAGCGVGTNRMGPEVGMAEALSSVYNKSTGRYTGFIKYAVGGTSLMNVFTGQNQAAGNWVSPSYSDTLYRGEITAKTGGLYYNFLTEVQTQMEAYREAGFNPIIKGMYWMQGESDVGRVAEYVEAITYFVNDMRRDLSVQTGQDLMNMPFVIGEISRTFSSVEAMNKNTVFIEMQNTLPSKITNCYVIKSSVYDINTSEGVVGSDRYHWNYIDCIAIGKLVGECLKNFQ